MPTKFPLDKRGIISPSSLASSLAFLLWPRPCLGLLSAPCPLALVADHPFWAQLELSANSGLVFITVKAQHLSLSISPSVTTSSTAVLTQP